MENITKSLYCIYALIHPKKNYPIYVGCTQDLQRRFNQHRIDYFQYPRWTDKEPKEYPLIKILLITYDFQKARLSEIKYIEKYRDTIFNNPKHKVHYNHKPIKAKKYNEPRKKTEN